MQFFLYNSFYTLTPRTR